MGRMASRLLWWAAVRLFGSALVVTDEMLDGLADAIADDARKLGLA